MPPNNSIPNDIELLCAFNTFLGWRQCVCTIHTFVRESCEENHRKQTLKVLYMVGDKFTIDMNWRDRQNWTDWQTRSARKYNNVAAFRTILAFGIIVRIQHVLRVAFESSRELDWVEYYTMLKTNRANIRCDMSMWAPRSETERRVHVDEDVKLERDSGTLQPHIPMTFSQVVRAI